MTMAPEAVEEWYHGGRIVDELRNGETEGGVWHLLIVYGVFLSCSESVLMGPKCLWEEFEGQCQGKGLDGVYLKLY